MTKRSYTLGALAATAVLAVPALASANVSVACAPNPDYLRVTSSNHPAGAPILTTLTRDGLPFDSREQADDGAFDVLAPEGSTYVASTVQYGYTFASTPFVKRCAAPIPPPPIITPPQEPERPEVVTPEPTESKVKRPPKRKPPRAKITCRYLVKIGAGPREFTRRGWYPNCKPPAKPKRPSHVPVTG